MNLNEKLTKLDSVKAEIDAQRPISADQEQKLMQKFRLDWNYHSNAIEGNSLSIGETAALISYGLTAKGKPFKDHLDISGHDTALSALVDLVRNQEPLTEHVIRGLHELMLGGTHDVSTVDDKGGRTTRTIRAGQYKSNPNHVQTEGGIVRQFASPTETPLMMADLLAWYRQELAEKTLHPVVFAAMFHHRFVAIHPFDDGNGRMARIIMNITLMQMGYSPAILRIEDRNPYISSLVQADAGELSSLIDLVADATLRSSELFVKAINGGAIDDLGDFDKQLLLLRQSVLDNNEAESPATAAEMLAVCENLLIPAYRRIEQRLEHIAPMFASAATNSIATLQDGTNIVQKDLGQLAAILPAAAAGRPFLQMQLFFQARAFAKNAKQDFMIQVMCNFGRNDFVVTSTLTGIQTGEHFKSDYARVFTAVDSEQLAKLILTDVLASINKIVRPNN
ncbi:filamentation induced by cAMP protein Fic [Caballeronia sordidicola]|uniref:Filamentation induced by cAMP protein Fic n=1 Tax=Caballeronia sordidicola TaxID=196367 RepID=A0A158EWP6_CABSO|nr:Fic family protein [Caballeronia sordidicola]SAL11923.1 filamentation induced by cAMP protein Fic [Caballeronia sordidicola]